MRFPFQPSIERRCVRNSLPPQVRQRLAALQVRSRQRARDDSSSTAGLLSLARFVAMDLETTGPSMMTDRIISIGAVAVSGRGVRHDDAFEVVVRQDRESRADNILIHQIGGQQQRGGAEPVGALLEFLEFLDGSIAVAFRAEFDSTVLGRELHQCLGIRQRTRFLDLAIILPALFPNTQNDTLDDWLRHFGQPPIARHQAIADAYANAQLLLLALEQARRLDLVTAGDLLKVEKSQRWLGLRR